MATRENVLPNIELMRKRGRGDYYRQGAVLNNKREGRRCKGKIHVLRKIILIMKER